MVTTARVIGDSRQIAENFAQAAINKLVSILENWQLK
jgi:hypothetical protein